MAPGYRPLPITVTPQGLPPEIFQAPPTITLDDAINANLIQRARELANQQNEITVTRAQQGLDESNQIRDALKAQYGDMQDVGNFDPQEALKTAEKIALQGGNLDTALNVEKVRRSYSSASDRPLSADELTTFKAQGLDLPDGATLADARLQLAIKNSGLRKDQIEGIDKRFSTNLDYKKSKDQAPGLFEPIEGDGGKPMPITDHQKTALSNIQGGLDQILRNADDLATAIDENRITYGDTLRAQQQFVANILPALRRLDNQGVRFNEFLKDIDIKQLGDDAGLSSRIAGLFVGQDPAAAVRRFAAEVARQAQMTANSNNARFSADKVQSFDPTTYDLFSNYGLFDRGQNPVAATPGQDSIRIPRAAQSAPERPGMQFVEFDRATGLPVYRRSK